MTNYTIDAVLFEREHGCWVGQYLQHDIGAQAESLEQLSYELQKAIAGHFAICIKNKIEPLTDLSAAPQEYWDMFTNAKLDVSSSEDAPGFSLPKMMPVPHTRMKVAA